MNNCIRKQSSKGFGLLEVLITVLLFAVGLLGLASLQVKAQKAELESLQRAQALLLVNSMVSRMNNNRAARDCYPDQAAEIGVDSDPSSGCHTVADRDLSEWDDMLEGAAENLSGTNVGGLVGARGCIVGNNNVYTISVAWQGLSETSAPANTCAQNKYGNDAQRRVVSQVIRFATLN
ncbi:type IV pilus modification protein PilV [Sedimenticola hydrogenitrophicus]|uniref:type IV pilus modification protein PilV n=1 Tax=Sedimenticola hydrogenitrophicus TaxID=2967975 RepID=UPI0023AEDB21|nr:type IV pilus modification protein PilV [Sedimenticola hydrogenitrophicus]